MQTVTGQTAYFLASGGTLTEVETARSQSDTLAGDAA
ncbi:hypothetical protein FP2506_16889 [Fulvimarina pelagi HTCC2506]|uniref:Uncharacterized protein n=1 Tax=Fulvimarina pelagi HTCC2506 TaxID=314231 RepID=Q0G2Q2_9HYPH|nr:hypothetical protein FP2506_16889 [Fulvimarina pelagi HTCC2506]